MAVVVSAAWSAAWSLALIWFVEHTIGANIDIFAEIEGLDKQEIGEEAYLMLEKVQDEDPDLLLCEATAKGDLIEVRKLFKQNGEVNVSDYDQRTPLHIAASKNFLDIAKFLIDKGANLESEDKYGRIPIEDALVNFHYQVILLFN